MLDVFLGVFLALGTVVTFAISINAVRVNRIPRVNRYAVTLKGGEGDFSGVMVRKSLRELKFEYCTTVPRGADEVAQPILGTVTIDRSNVAYLQEMPNDLV